MTAESPRVTVIVLNWNGRDDTLECLDSLSRVEYPAFETVMVDNGSSDDSVGAVWERFPAVKVLETGANLGFAGGNNVGIRYALEGGTDYVFLLNNDAVVDPWVISRLVGAAGATGGGGIFGAKIFYYSVPTRIWYAGGTWSGESARFLHLGQGETEDGTRYGELAETDYACGCAMLVRAAVFREVGLLHETFFLTYEETDLCYRARRAGYRSYMVPDARVWHKVSRSMGGEGSVLFNYFMARNRLLWAERNLRLDKRVALCGRVAQEVARSYLSPHLTPDEARAVLSRGRLGGRLAVLGSRIKDPVRRARLRGLGDYLLRRFGNCPESVRRLARGDLSGR